MTQLNLETCPGFEIISVGPTGGTRIKCPECSKVHHMVINNGKLNKQLRITCPCGGQWKAVLCTRSWFRKCVSLPGSWKNTRGVECGMIVENLSKTGIRFLSSRDVELQEEQNIKITFVLNNGGLVWINEWARVVRIEDRVVAVEFINPSEHSQKVIGFYLMN